MRTQFPSHLFRWHLVIPALLLVGGAAAWLIILAVIGKEWSGTDSPEPTAQPKPMIGHPTLSAAVSTQVPPTPTPTDTPSITPTTTPIPTVTPLPVTTVPVTAIPAQAITATLSESALPTTCAPPAGWEQYTVQPDDTLFAFVLGSGSTVTVDDLVAANCLTSRYLQIGQVLYLPPGAADNAPPSVPYVPPSGSGGNPGPRTPNCPCVITVGTGWRREQIADAVDASQTAFTGADFLAVTGPGASAPYDFVMSRPAEASMEGFLFPGTYTAQNDTTAEGFRNTLLDTFAANVSPQMRSDATAQGVTFYQALVIASIVQREVYGPEAQKLVASVYYNRFRDNNRMASTVTVQYAIGRPGNWWPRVTHDSLSVDSPFNTYNRPGLPPAPIDNPGLSAIVAAVYPPQTDYYYHTAACDGSGEAFAVTYEEHLANVNCQN